MNSLEEGHVARLIPEDPAHRIISCRDPRGWTMPKGRPHASGLRQVESYLKDTGMAGLGDGQTEAEGLPSQGGRATRCSDVCLHTGPT